VAIVVVGGHTRNIGKTSVVAGLIAAMPEMRWTAIKITQFGHGVCSANGEPCDCETADHAMAISEEHNPTTGTDSSRYLAAGAARSFWVRTREGQLQAAMPRVRQLIDAADNVVIESNSVLRFLRPDVSLSVMDPSVGDFKASAMRYLDRADALVVAGDAEIIGAWDGVSAAMLASKPHFAARPPVYCSAELAAFVRERLAARAWQAK
jgi:molybdopterin-guanine dinucleotide biosynthesis protein